MAGFTLPRRHLLVGLATCAVPLSLTRPAEATLARALTLHQLVRSSGRVVRGTAAERYSTWQVIGGRRRIVTHTRVLVAGDLATPHDDPEVLVMTLGGRVDDVAQVAHGEAALNIGEECVVFLTNEHEGARRVTALSQGHYPLEQKQGALLLRRSPQLPELIDRKNAAVDRLASRPFSEAARLIREAM